MSYTSSKGNEMGSPFYTADKKKEKQENLTPNEEWLMSRFLLVFPSCPYPALLPSILVAELWPDWRNQMCENVKLISEIYAT